MEFDRIIHFDDEAFDFCFGSLKVNIVYMHFTPADPDWVEEYHCHSTYEIHIIPKGRGTLITDSEVYDIVPGTVYVTGPNIYHRQKTLPEDPMMEYCINMELKPCRRRSENSRISEELDGICSMLMQTVFWFGEDRYECGPIMEKIYDELNKKETGYYTCVQNYIEQLLVQLVRNYNICSADKRYEAPSKTLYDRTVNILDSYLYHEYYKNPSIGQLAEEIGVSPRQLQRIVSGHYGMSFREKQNSVRIKNAKMLLTETDLTIEEIALRIGYSSAGYFAERFKKSEGITPAAYRSSHKKASVFYKTDEMQ